MKFTHLIISKVNLRWLPQAEDEIWLKDRISLFNNILRPSIVGQTNKNFKFVTLWGYEPEGKIENEYQIKLNSKTSYALYLEMLPKLKELIDEDLVLTTRVDTDNALRYDFVENLHKHITKTELPFYYDTNKMHMINLNTLQKRTWPAINTSAFISVIETKSNYICIPYKTGHARIQKFVKGIKFDDLGCICTIHGENIYMKKELGEITNFDEKKLYNINM